MLLKVTPTKTGLSESYYGAKRLESKLGLQAKRIDCCVDGFMLFYDKEYDKSDGTLLE